MGVFEDFVNANLPLRVVEYTPLNSGYDSDPNLGGAPVQIKNAPVGALYYNNAGELYVKSTTSPGSWVLVSSGGGGGAGEVSASYLVLSTTSSLTNERVFTIGTGLSSSDGGANGNFTVDIDNTVVSTLSGSRFTGRLWASGGLTGSLQEVSPGVPYVLAGPNITLVTNSNGSIEITGSAAGGAAGEISASYLVLSTTSSLANERVFTIGTGLSSSDGGANGNFTLSSPDNFSYKNVVSGSTTIIPVNQQMVYTGDLTVDGTLVVDGDISQTVDSFIAVALAVSGGNVDISASAPPVAGYALIATSPTTAEWSEIPGGAGAAGEVSASYLVLSTTSSLANERVLTVGTGLSSSDGGANGNFTVDIDNTVVSTLSGSRFTGRLWASGGLTGSLQEVSPGVPYVLAGPNITLVTNSNGSIEITGSAAGGAAGEVSASFLVLSATSSLANERVFTIGTGLSSSDGGANGDFHVTAPFVSASYLTFNSESLLPNERRFTIGTGLSSSDGGANGDFTVSSPDNFSYKKIVTGSTVNIPVNQQMLFDGDLIVEGLLYIDGEIVQNNDSLFAVALVVSGGKVDISASAPPVAGYALIATSPTTAEWSAISGSGGSSGGAGEVSASYLVLSTTSSLANERVFTIGTGLSSSDGGANGNFTVDIDNTIVSTLSGSRFTGRLWASGGLTGSLQEVSPGVPYVLAGPNITLVTNSNGSIEITGSAAGGTAGEVSASYLVLSTTSSLANERVFTVGTGLSSSDGGANGNFTVDIDNTVVSTLSGSRFTGRLWASGGLTGSLQEVSPGVPYVLAGPNITLVTNSNGSIEITGSAAGGTAGEVSASYLVLSTTSSLANERVFTVGTGLSSSDGGANGNFTLSSPDNFSYKNVVSGSTTIIPVNQQMVYTGDLTVDGTLVVDGDISQTVDSFIAVALAVSGGNVDISASAPPVAGYALIATSPTTAEWSEISGGGGSSGSVGEVSASYLVLSTTSSLANERVFTIGTGLSSSDGGANGNFTVDIDNTVVSTLSGSRFTGMLWASGGLTGSLQEVSPGVPYVLAGPNITLVTNSNGSIEITGSAAGGAAGEVSASFLVLSTTSSLANERVFTVGTGLSSSDGGANGNFTVDIDNTVVSTLSGSRFTGRLWASGGLTGSLQEVSPGVPYVLAGPNITLVTNSNGSIEITGSSGEVSASYLVLSTTSSLANERVFTIGTGLSSSDGGANGNFTLSSPDNFSYKTVVSGSTTIIPVNQQMVYVGDLTVDGTLVVDGDINQTVDSFIAVALAVSGGNVDISASAPPVAGYALIATSPTTAEWSEIPGGAAGEVSASFLVLSTTSSLANERVFTIGTGLSSSDGGANGNFTVDIDNTVVSTLSGSRFTGMLWASGGLTGSLQEVSPGVPYVLAGPNITLVTNSNGSIEITGSSGEVSASYLVLSTTSSLANERVFTVGTGLSSSDGGANGDFHVTAPFVSASYLTLNSESLLPNERVFTIGTGLSSSDGGANGNFTVDIDNTVVSTLSGSRFTGMLWASGGLTGSLQEVSPGVPYVLAGPNITLVTNSNGSIEISVSVVNGETIIDATLATTNSVPTSIFTYTPSGPGRACAFQFQTFGSRPAKKSHFVMTALATTNTSSVVEVHDVYYINGPYRDDVSWDVDVVSASNGTDIEILVTGDSALSASWRIKGTVLEHSVAEGGD